MSVADRVVCNYCSSHLRLCVPFQGSWERERGWGQEEGQGRRPGSHESLRLWTQQTKKKGYFVKGLQRKSCADDFVALVFANEGRQSL